MAKIESSASGGPRTKWFVVVTGVYCLVVAFSSWRFGFLNVGDPSRSPLNPHEWGDVLAGVFSPLAFLWLVYASLSQKAELELQRGELALNNVAQRDQFDAMNAQAGAMDRQVELMREQAEREAERRSMESRELRVWRELYLQGVARYHDALINHTAHMVRDIKPFVPVHVSRAQELFGLDNFRGTSFVESGVPRFHYFDEATERNLIALVGLMESARISEKNYIVSVMNAGTIEATDIDGMAAVLNHLASEAHNLASEGIRRLREGRPDPQRPA